MTNQTKIWGSIVILLAGIIIGSVIFISAPKVPLAVGGIGMSPNFNTGTATTTQCAVAGGTLLAATSSGRTSFLAAGVGSSTAYLCRSSTCTSFNGIPLRAIGSTTATGMPLFEQNDGYIGPYFCASGGSGSTTIHIEYTPSVGTSTIGQ